MNREDGAHARERIAIVGLGLIGGSIARALKACDPDRRLTGCLETAADAERALRLGLVDEATTDPAAAAENATLVVVAVPIGAMAGVFAALREALADHAVVTDVGSTKASVIADARAALGPRIARFVPGHPIAGTEHSGLEAGWAGLYQGRRVILTPLVETEGEAVRRVTALWRTLGGLVSTMDFAHHDQVLAATSHLPHVLAFALVDSLARMPERSEIFEYAASGFADFSRIASSDPALWRDIVTANRDALIPLLDRYIGDLGALRQALAAGDRDILHACFARAKRARDGFATSRRGTR